MTNKTMKPVFICSLFILCHATSFAVPIKDSLIDQLNKAIKQATDYDNNKLKEISRLKRLSEKSAKSDISRQFEIHLKLYEEYKYYNYDSAFTYAKKLQQLSENRYSPSLFIDSKLKEIFITLSGGMFKETFDSLEEI